MKIITTKTVKKHSPEWGWIDQVQFYTPEINLLIFKIRPFHFWSENHNAQKITESVESLEYRAMMSIKADNYRQVSFSEMSANLPDLSTAEFDKFQQSIYPTRF